MDTGVMHVAQAIRAIKRNRGLQNLVNFWELFPEAFYNVIVAQEKTLKEKPELLEAFDAAVEFTGYTLEELALGRAAPDRA